MPLYVIFLALCFCYVSNKKFYKVYLRAKIFDCLEAHFGSVCTYVLWNSQDVRSKHVFFHYRIMVLGPVFHRIPPPHFGKEENELCRSQVTWARSYGK